MMDAENGDSVPTETNYSSDQLAHAQRQVEDVKGIMGENVQRIIARGETLENLDARADNLTVHADEFMRTSRKVKNKMWWQNTKMMLILAAVVIVVIIIIIVATVGVPSGGGDSSSSNNSTRTITKRMVIDTITNLRNTITSNSDSNDDTASPAHNLGPNKTENGA